MSVQTASVRRRWRSSVHGACAWVAVSVHDVRCRSAVVRVVGPHADERRDNTGNQWRRQCRRRWRWRGSQITRRTWCTVSRWLRQTAETAASCARFLAYQRCWQFLSLSVTQAVSHAIARHSGPCHEHDFVLVLSRAIITNIIHEMIALFRQSHTRSGRSHTVITDVATNHQVPL